MSLEASWHLNKVVNTALITVRMEKIFFSPPWFLWMLFKKRLWMVGKEMIFSGIIRELNILWIVSQSLFHLSFTEVMGWSSSLSFFLFVVFVCWWVVYFVWGFCFWATQRPFFAGIATLVWSATETAVLVWSVIFSWSPKLWDPGMWQDHCFKFCLSAITEQVLIWQQVLYSYTLF